MKGADQSKVDLVERRQCLQDTLRHSGEVKGRAATRRQEDPFPIGFEVEVQGRVAFYGRADVHLRLLCVLRVSELICK